MSSKPARSGPAAEQSTETSNDSSEKRDPRQAQSRDEGLAASKARVTRIPIGRMQRLEGIAAPYRDSGHYLRFVLDKPGRLDTHLRAGYEFVTDSNGAKVTYPSGAMHLHLMKLPNEFREEDLKSREEDIAARLSSEIKMGNEEYSPEGASVALTKQGVFEPAA